MIEERILNYKKYLELKGYQVSSIRGLLRRAELYESKTSYLSLSLKPSTLQLYHYQKKVYLRYLEEVEQEVHYIKEEYYKKTLSSIEILSQKEVGELVKNCKDVRDQVVLVCLYSLGLRLREVSNIEIEDIDMENHIVLIRKSKTKKQRQVPINKNSLEVLLTYIEDERLINKGNKLLQGSKGNLTSDGIYQILKRIATRTKIEKRIYPHLLRHSIASHLLERGMELEQISKFLGHSSMESTQRYTHLEVRDKEVRSNK